MMKKRGMVVLFVITLLMPAGVVLAAEDAGKQGAKRDGFGEQPDEKWLNGPISGREGKGGARGREDGGMPHGRWWRLSDVADQLKLTPKEKEKLDSLFMDSRRKMIDSKSLVEKEALEMEALLEGKNLDEKAVLSQFRKTHDAKRKMSEARFGFIIAVRKLLGYERFQQLKSSVKKRSRRGGRNSGQRPSMRQERSMSEERR